MELVGIVFLAGIFQVCMWIRAAWHAFVIAYVDRHMTLIPAQEVLVDAANNLRIVRINESDGHFRILTHVSKLDHVDLPTDGAKVFRVYSGRGYFRKKASNILFERYIVSFR